MLMHGCIESGKAVLNETVIYNVNSYSSFNFVDAIWTGWMSSISGAGEIFCSAIAS